MKFKFIYKGRKHIIDKVVECRSLLSQTCGLMFGNDKKPLLFVFDKLSKMSIHSWFVRKKFVAIWLLKGQVVDVKIVRPWRCCVRSNSVFDTLLEIPFDSENQIFKFLVGSEKGLNT